MKMLGFQLSEIENFIFKEYKYFLPHKDSCDVKILAAFLPMTL